MECLPHRMKYSQSGVFISDYMLTDRMRDLLYLVQVCAIQASSGKVNVQRREARILKSVQARKVRPEAS